MTACFNAAPPIPKKKPGTWDINILLDYLVGLGDNKNLSVNSLAGKSMILILLSTMCRGSELLLLKVTNMSLICGGIEFVLDTPTKTYNRFNFTIRPNLQKLTISSFDENPLLCPVKTLLDYLETTTAFRGFIEPVFICCLSDHTRPASKDTINCWIKTHMAAAGLGDFEVKSSHHASSTTALLSGIPLDKLINQVGWSTASTFVSNYMLPMMENKVTTSVVLDPKTSVLDDQHGFSKLWQTQPKCVSTSSAPKRSKKFVKIQENKINNARSRLRAVIQGEGGESSPLTKSVQQPSKLTSKIKSKLKLSQYQARPTASSKIQPHTAHSKVSGTTKNKKTDKLVANDNVTGPKTLKIVPNITLTQQAKNDNKNMKAKQKLHTADKANKDKLSRILAPVQEAKELDMIDNFDIVYSEDGIPVIRTENITRQDLDNFVSKVSPLPLPNMSADNILSEIDKETECEIREIFDVFTKSGKRKTPATTTSHTVTVAEDSGIKDTTKPNNCTVVTKHGKVSMHKDNLQLLSDACFSAAKLPQAQVPVGSTQNEAMNSMTNVSLDQIPTSVNWRGQHPQTLPGLICIQHSPSVALALLLFTIPIKIQYLCIFHQNLLRINLYSIHIPILTLPHRLNWLRHILLRMSTE